MLCKQSWLMTMADEKLTLSVMLVSKRFASNVRLVVGNAFLLIDVDSRWFDRRFVLTERCHVEQRCGSPENETVEATIDRIPWLRCSLIHHWIDELRIPVLSYWIVRWNTKRVKVKHHWNSVASPISRIYSPRSPHRSSDWINVYF